MRAKWAEGGVQSGVEGRTGERERGHKFPFHLTVARASTAVVHDGGGSDKVRPRKGGPPPPPCSLILSYISAFLLLLRMHAACGIPAIAPHAACGRLRNIILQQNTGEMGMGLVPAAGPSDCIRL